MKASREPRSASSSRTIGRHRRLVALALCGTAVVSAGGLTLAQDSDQQIRCMQLQQELASVQRGGGGGGRGALPGIERQIQEANRVYQGTKAAMEDAGCFERFFIFGQGLVRSPKCLNMNARAEDARRQLSQLQQQREAVAGGRGNRRRQAELMDALARNGCGRQYQQPQQARREGGGLFGWFGRGRQEEAALPQEPVYRSIDPNGRYRSVCVRTCDGFFFPVSYSTYASQLAQDAAQCQANCAAPAELYVYRNPGQEIAQAISLSGVPYTELPAAFRYRKEYVKGCSCKAAEYNPTEIEAANQRAEATPDAGQPGAKRRAPAQAAAPAPAQAEAEAPPQQINIDMTNTLSQDAPAAEASGEAPAATGALPEPPAAEAPPPAAAAPVPQQSSVAKSRPAPPPQ